jgi:3'-5' exonuclease
LAVTPANQAHTLDTADPKAQAAYLVMDTESVPDGRLLAAVKYAADNITPEEAILRAQAEARELSHTGSDFLPVTFQYPVAVCLLKVGADFTLQKINRLGEPHFQPRQIVEQFWSGLSKTRQVVGDRLKLVTFNGRGFDLPLMEMAAFRYGCSIGDPVLNRHRFNGYSLDLMEWLSNFGALRMAGGLDVLAKLLGKPGKTSCNGEQVYQMHLAGKIKEINDYCTFDTLDTYFVFLRTRVMAGVLTLENEHQLVLKAKDFVKGQVDQYPALQQYLDNWGDWNPWP